MTSVASFLLIIAACQPLLLAHSKPLSSGQLATATDDVIKTTEDLILQPTAGGLQEEIYDASHSHDNKCGDTKQYRRHVPTYDEESVAATEEGTEDDVSRGAPDGGASKDDGVKSKPLWATHWPHAIQASELAHGSGETDEEIGLGRKEKEVASLESYGEDSRVMSSPSDGDGKIAIDSLQVGEGPQTDEPGKSLVVLRRDRRQQMGFLHLGSPPAHTLRDKRQQMGFLHLGSPSSKVIRGPKPSLQNYLIRTLINQLRDNK